MPAFRVLGPLEVRDAAGRSVVIRRRKQRALLVLLIARGGEPVTADQLITALWGTDPPASARANVHTYLSDLRRLLGTAQPERTPAGYRLRVTPDDCDALLFDRLVAEGRRAMAGGR